MGKVFGRDPAVILAAVGALWQILSAFGLDWDPKLQSIVTAAVAAVLGLIVAVQVNDGILPAVAGVFTAAVSLLSYFAMDWSAETQAQVVGALMLVIGAFVRTQVTAPVPASVSPAGVLVAKNPV